MNVIKFICGLLTMGFFIQAPAAAQADVGEQFKKYINKVVQKAEQADNADEKRAVLNNSFDKMIETATQVENMAFTGEQDRVAISKFKETIIEKKNELNGLDGFEKVKDNRLDDFSDYVQQDLEQAQTYITLSLGVAIIIALLLLLL